MGPLPSRNFIAGLPKLERCCSSCFPPEHRSESRSGAYTGGWFVIVIIEIKKNGLPQIRFVRTNGTSVAIVYVSEGQRLSNFDWLECQRRAGELYRLIK